MKIYFDGDSYTYGSELKDRENSRFSKLLCDRLGAEETNKALHGSSNKAILRRTLTETDITDYDLVVINLTEPCRTEYYDIKVGWKRVRIGKLMGGYAKTEHEDWWRYYMKNIWTEEEGNLEEKIAYLSIKNLCKANNIPLIISTIRGRENWILPDVNDYSPLDFDLNLGDSKYPRAPDRHPNEKGHSMITNDLVKIYENLL